MQRREFARNLLGTALLLNGFGAANAFAAPAGGRAIVYK